MTRRSHPPPARAATRDGRPAAPVRIAHLGPGNFFRAHQAWYTEHAPDAADWGIAAFAGRRGAVAREPGRPGRAVHAARARRGRRPSRGRLGRLAARLGRARRLAPLLRPPGAGAGHHHRHRGRLPARRRRRPGPRTIRRSPPTSPRCSRARRRRRRGHRPRQARRSGSRCAARTACPAIAVVPCDNVPDNGAMVARVVGELAAAVDPAPRRLDRASTSSFVTTMVDRITPHTTDDDRARGAGAGRGGRPRPGRHRALRRVGARRGVPRRAARDWEAVGARFVDDVVPWEHRKLWLLNGSHSLMAYAGDAPRPRDRRAERSRTRSCAAGSSSGGTTPRGTCRCPPRRSRPTAPRCWTRYAQPADPPPAAPDRRRRLAEGADPDPADRAGRAGRRAACRRVRRGCSPPGCATCAGRAPRSRTWRPRSSPRSPRATWTTPCAACWPGSAPTTRGCTPPSRRWPASSAANMGATPGNRLPHVTGATV